MKNVRCCLFRLIVTLLVFPCLTLTGCSVTSDTKKAQNTESKIITCKEPRPQVCTLHYQPVCATRQSAVEKNYANGCTACADKHVVSYREGVCE